MRIEDILTLLVALISLPLVITILLRKPHQRINEAYALFAIQGPAWGLVITLFRTATNQSLATFWAQIIYLIGSLVPPLFYYFSTLIMGKRFKKRYKILMFYVSLPAIFFLLNFTDLFIKDVRLTHDGNHVDLGPAYIAWIVWFAVIMNVSLLQLTLAYRKARGYKRIQYKYMLLSAIPPVTMSFPFDIVLPLFGNYRLIWVGPISIAFMAAIIAYAMAKHRFFGVKFIIGRALYYVSVAFVLLGSFYLAITVQNAIWGDVFSTGGFISGFVVSLFFFFLYERVNSFIKKFFEGTILYSSYNPLEIINNIVRASSTELNMDKIVSYVLARVRSTFSMAKTGIIIFDTDSRKVLYTKLIGFENDQKRQTRELLEVVNYWATQENAGKKAEILVQEEITPSDAKRSKTEAQRQRIRKFMKQEEIAIILPLNRKVQLNGLMLIGIKDNNDPYTIQDINFLESVIANTSVAVGRSILYEQVSNFAHDLERKVDDATKELQKRAAQLQKQNIALENASKRERDMMDIVGHELRTPATVVKSALGFIEIMLKEEKIDKKKVHLYVRKALDGIEREINLINTFLGATKISSQQMQLEPNTFSITELTEKLISEQKADADKKGLKITLEKPKNTPDVDADKLKISEVIVNLLSNAIKYTEKGGINIRIEHNAPEETVSVYIKDSGIGIPKSERSKLFTKFGRLSQYTTDTERMAQIVRPGGTGLGLYLAKGIIELHKGKIGVESEKGRGSTFYFTIPIKNKISPNNLMNPLFKDGEEKDVFKRMKLDKSAE